MGLVPWGSQTILQSKTTSQGTARGPPCPLATPALPAQCEQDACAWIASQLVQEWSADHHICPCPPPLAGAAHLLRETGLPQQGLCEATGRERSHRMRHNWRIARSKNLLLHHSFPLDKVIPLSGLDSLSVAQGASSTVVRASKGKIQEQPQNHR